MSKFPTQRCAHAEIVLVGAYGRSVVEVFVKMKTPPKILHQFYP